MKCSAGIDYVAEDIITLDPQQTANLSFTMHSIYSVGKINKCDGGTLGYCQFCHTVVYTHFPVELLNQNGELQDNMTVYFETEDTCFCYGHCGCAVS